MSTSKDLLNNEIKTKIELDKKIDILDNINNFLSNDNVSEEGREQAEEYKKIAEQQIEALLEQHSNDKALLKEKCNGLCMSIGYLNAEIDYLRSLKKTIDSKIKAKECSIEWGKNSIEYILSRCGLDINDGVDLGVFKVKRNTVPKLIINDAEINDDYKLEKAKTTIEVNKEKIKEDLLNGIDVKGAKLEYSLKINNTKIKESKEDV